MLLKAKILYKNFAKTKQPAIGQIVKYVWALPSDDWQLYIKCSRIDARDTFRLVPTLTLCQLNFFFFFFGKMDNILLNLTACGISTPLYCISLLTQLCITLLLLARKWWQPSVTQTVCDPCHIKWTLLAHQTTADLTDSTHTLWSRL